MFRQGILLFLRKFLVSKGFMDGRGGYHVFPSKIFCLTVPKNFRRGTLLYFRKFLVSKNFMHNRGGGGITIFRRNFFCLTVPKNFVEEPVCVSENFGCRKTLCLRGESHDFLKKKCCLAVPKSFVEESFSASLVSGIEKC